MNKNTYPQAVDNFPLTKELDNICAGLKASKSRSLVLTADTGSGKSTVLPLGLLNHFNGKILMLEPRRLAVLNIANRVSELLGEPVGNTCGYSIHLESKGSEKTRFTVVTEAVLIRRLQQDPELSGVSVVVLDEFHERSIHADLALAFLKEAMQLRDDLFLVVMSATMETTRLAGFLGGGNTENAENSEDVRNTENRENARNIQNREDAENIENTAVFDVKGHRFNVDVAYMPSVPIKNVVINEYRQLKKVTEQGQSASVLVFLPGIYEINKLFSELEDTLLGSESEDILILHSSVPIEKQKEVFVPQNKVRIILSSAIAETSVTVPDVKVVVDSGLCRVNVYDANTGMNRLVTQKESFFNAEQRTGRAGRVCEGRCVRLWSQNEALIKTFSPEIERSDLTDLVLECFKWGIQTPEAIEWLSPPPDYAWQNAVKLLEELRCIKEGKITLLGEFCLHLGLGVRLSCVAASGLFHRNSDFSTSVALNFLSNGKMSEKLQQKQALDLKRRVQIFKENPQFFASFPQDEKKISTGYALLYGFPDRLGIKVEENIYQFASGRKAALKESPANPPEYIVAVNVNAGTSLGTIFDWHEVEKDCAEQFINERTHVEEKTFFENSKLFKFEQTLFGKIVIKEKKLPVLPGDYKKALCCLVAEKGVQILPISKKCAEFLKRVQFYIENSLADGVYGSSRSPGSGSSSDNTLNGARDCPRESGRTHESAEPEAFEVINRKFCTLKDTVTDWLLPFLTEGPVNEKVVSDALFWYLDGDRINKTVPVELLLENGKKRKLVYEEQNGKIIPVLEIIIQQIFGCFTNPKIMGVPVLLRLLSPARRPLQVTQDLDNFWPNTWPEICKEMKGRYPKHNWDYRVTESEK
ncbi:MAG: DEAD/DEAH box helicase [Treponema sp.]|nr:DEAD/DEAH box helicase [Treponema sp.]